MESKLHIKNMVCPRCITTVQAIFKDAAIDIKTIKLGEVTILEKPTKEKIQQLDKRLLDNGFELLKSTKSKIISDIKSIIIQHIHHKKEKQKINFSELLSEQLNHEYTSLSKLFSAVEGITIERFILKQKIERVKELLFYNELTLSEIAFLMDYSSVAHLSSQFKKETGMTPTQFKKNKTPKHNPLDTL